MSVAAPTADHASPVPEFKHATSVISLLAVALACVALRCVSSYDPFPYWSGDPFLVQSPVLGLTPALAITADTLCFATSAAALVLCITGRSLQRCTMLGLLAATICLAWQHYNPIASDYWDGIVLSRHWLAGFTLAIACVAASRLASLRLAVTLLTSSTLIGIVLLVLAKGFSQVIVEHPQMMKEFRTNKDAIIAAQGWEPNSSMARAYIRRLEQPEASGWFGLANIFATLCAAGFTTLLMLLALTWRNTPRSHRSEENSINNKALLVLAVCTAACAAGVYLAGSKGGFAVAGLGILLAAFALFTRRKDATQTQSDSKSILHRIAAWIGPALVAAALLAIVARGIIGERLGELSLLFRWFYMQGAAKILANNPLGVGAAGFKDAYMIHKPALSPEDTSFAHSVLIDWIVALGPIGLLAIGAWLLLLRNASKSLVTSHALTSIEPENNDLNAEALLLRNTRSIACFALLAPTALAAFLERDAATPEAGLTRAVGLASALGTAWAMHVLISKQSDATRSNQDTFSPALAAGAIVACVHSQIELSGVMGGSAAWCLALLGAAAALARCTSSTSISPNNANTARYRIPIFALVVVAAVICAMPAFRAWNWERSLRRAYEPAAIVQEFVTRRAELATAAGRNTESATSARDALVQDLAKSKGSRVGSTNSEIDIAIEQQQLSALQYADTNLRHATTVAPLHFPTLRAYTRINHATALLRQKIAKADPSELDTPVTLLVQAKRRFFKNVNYWSWLGTMSRERALGRTPNSPELKNDLDVSINAWSRAHELSPHDTIHALKLSDLFAEMGKADDARQWATKALEANVNMRLDPLRQLTDSERSRLESRTK